ncbi:amino acid racemase [Proteinivorax hydrogeniformans]|uniref:Amino acid racemase n=1 Tax=Proteinivorax hydrogeniformans TaxID=1826727 RepID=A0AAU8HWY8_9FIRM
MKLGIIGGMGPLATAELFKRIVNKSDVQIDQQHLNILIDNNTAIPDRTAYVLDKGPDPTFELIKTARRLEEMESTFLAMPCNTAHVFYEEVQSKVNIPIINMVDETCKYISSLFARGTKVGILATDGTIASKVYHDALKSHGHIPLSLDKDCQQYIMDIIYSIKAGKAPISRQHFDNCTNLLIRQGAKPIILGCTELSILKEHFKLSNPFIDPLDILTRSILKHAKIKEK